MANFNNFEPDYGTGPRSYMDIETGDITIVNDNGCGGGSIFHIRNSHDDKE